MRIATPFSLNRRLEVRVCLAHGALLVVGCGGETTDGNSPATGGSTFVSVGVAVGSGGSVGTGGIAAMGGTTVANTASCNTTADCTNCVYPSAPTSTNDCYCAECARTPMNVDLCNSNQAAYAKFCLSIARTCKAIPCVSGGNLMCIDGTCVPGMITN